MPDDKTRVAELLHEAGETHHVVYRIVDGDDPDWASWYADWLLDHSELPQLLGSAPVRSHLVHALVELDRNYTAEPRDERWEDWYAERLRAEPGAGYPAAAGYSAERRTAAGVKSPSASSEPPPASAAPAISALSRPGRRPTCSKNWPVPSGPAPPHQPASFCIPCPKK